MLRNSSSVSSHFSSSLGSRPSALRESMRACLALIRAVQASIFSRDLGSALSRAVRHVAPSPHPHITESRHKSNCRYREDFVLLLAYRCGQRDKPPPRVGVAGGSRPPGTGVRAAHMIILPAALAFRDMGHCRAYLSFLRRSD